MTSKAAVPIRFYDCPTPSYDEALHPCDRPILEWLLALAPQPEGWTPQAAEIVRIDQATFAAQAAAVASCEASKFASHPAPQQGVAISVSSRLAAASVGAGEEGEGLHAAVSVGFSPPVGCGSIPFQVIHRVKAVGGNYYPENTVFETDEQPPVKNGTGNFANTIVFDLVNQNTAWRDHLHQVFTGGTWRIRSSRVFGQYSEWELAGDPEPSLELQARGEAFDANRLKFEYPDFPSLYGATGPRWLVVHRYTHQQSGRWFYVSDWQSLLNSQNVSWPDAVFGRGHQSEITWDEFTAPDDGDPAFFDPEGTWVHQSGVIDFAMNNILVQTKYANALCAEHWRTINPVGIPDPRTAGFIGAQAYFEETVEVRTIRQYKACYRILSVNAVRGIGVLVSVKLINPFPFAACIVARMPIGSSSQDQAAHLLSDTDIVVCRNLPANSESAAIDFIRPVVYLDPAAVVDYRMTEVMFDATHGAGFAAHGFACAQNTYQDGVYITSIASNAQALSAAAGVKAEMWGFFNASGTRFWSSGSTTENSPADVVFSYQPLPTGAIASNYGLFSVTADVTAEIWNGYYGEWQPISQNGWTKALTPAQAVARYGATFTVNPGDAKSPAAYVNGWAIFTDWSSGNTTELEQYLLSLHPWIGDPNYRNIAFTVTHHPAVSVGLASPMAEDDYPGGYPSPAGDGSCCVVVKEAQAATAIEVRVK